MAETTEALRQDIDSLRESMTATMEHIELRVRSTVDTTVAKVRRSFDLEQQVRERPWVAVGLAALAGYLLGSLGERPRPAPRSGEPLRSHDPTRSGLGPDHEEPGLLADLAEQFGAELDLLSSAAAASAVSYLREMLAENLPQFEHEYGQLRGGPGFSQGAPDQHPDSPATPNRAAL